MSVKAKAKGTATYLLSFLELGALIYESLMPVAEIRITGSPLCLFQQLLRAHACESRNLVLWEKGAERIQSEL